MKVRQNDLPWQGWSVSWISSSACTFHALDAFDAIATFFPNFSTIGYEECDSIVKIALCAKYSTALPVQGYSMYHEGCELVPTLCWCVNMATILTYIWPPLLIFNFYFCAWAWSWNQWVNFRASKLVAICQWPTSRWFVVERRVNPTVRCTTDWTIFPLVRILQIAGT